MTKIFLKKKYSENTAHDEIKNQLLINLNDLELSVRARNSLTDQGITTLGDLVAYTEHDLRRFPKMGRTTIDELKNILDHHSLYLGMEIKLDDEKTVITQKIDEKENLIELSKEKVLELIKDFDETSLSQRSKNALRNLNCFYIGDILKVNREELFRINALGYKSILEIEEYINKLDLKFGDVLEPWDKNIILNLRKDLRDEISDNSRQELLNQDKLLEIELQRILNESMGLTKKDPQIKERVIDVLNSRFGLDGSPAKTLEIIGQKYNVTRERIRQNQQYGLRKLKILKPITPILDKIFEILDQSLPITEIELNKILKEKGLTELEWDFKGLQDFYESFSFKQDFYVSKINNIKVISKSSIDNAFREVMKNVRKRISNSGLMSLSECMKFKEVNFNNIKKESVKKFVQTMPLFSWLDDQEEWFTFYSTRNRLSNLVSKAALATDKINLTSLFEKIKNYHRLEDVNYDKKIFNIFCEICFECEVYKDEIKFLSPNSKLSNYEGYKGNIVAPNEQKMIEIFNFYGPILDWKDLRYLSSLNNVSEASLNMIMQFSVLFQRIDKATYILSGIKLDKVKETTKIDLMTANFKIEKCAYIKNQNQVYVEIYNNNSYLKTLAYPKTLVEIDNQMKGIFHEGKVFPIIS
ncbi:RNA polymerase alpha chain family protein,sigma-70 family protein [alpha proteobacterium HIMB5]|nr:RNA polymerase alpha chain family protein,sigma-70 family protein [alpha proteobacterium HIMB5]